MGVKLTLIIKIFSEGLVFKNKKNVLYYTYTFFFGQHKPQVRCPPIEVGLPFESGCSQGCSVLALIWEKHVILPHDFELCVREQALYMPHYITVSCEHAEGTSH